MKKNLIVIITLLFVLAAGAEFYVQSDLFAARIRPLVLEPLRRVLGNDAYIGWIRANLIPPYVEARDIAIPDEKGRPLIFIRKIRVSINLLPLLVHKLRMPSVLIMEPRILADRSRAGNFNLSPVIGRIQQNIAQVHGPSQYAVSFRTIVLNNGSLSFKDESLPARVTLSGIYATARLNLEGESVAVSLKNANASFAAPAQPEFSGDLKASVRYERGRFHIESFTFGAGDTKFSLAGKVGGAPDPDLDLKLHLRSGPETIGKLAGLLKKLRKEGAAPLDAAVTVRGTFTNPVVDGYVRFSGISYQGLLLQDARLLLTLRDRKLALSGEKWELSRSGKKMVVDTITASAEYSDIGLDIQHVTIKAGDLSLEVAGRADPVHGFASTVTMQSRDKGRSLSLLSSIPIEGDIGIKGELSGALNAPVFDGDLAAGPVTVRGILFDAAEGRVRLQGKKLRFMAVDVHQQKSRYFFNGSVDLSPEEPVFAARLKVIRSDVGSIVALFYRRLPLQISATGDMSFDGTVNDFNGSALLTVESGSAYGEAFTRGTVNAALTRDRISFPLVVVDKGNGTIEGSGWIGFDRTYQATIESHNVKLSQVDLLNGSLFEGGFDLSITSSGSFSRPQVNASLKVKELLLNHIPLGTLESGLTIADDMLTWKTGLSEERGTGSLQLGLISPYSWRAHASVNSDKIDLMSIFGGKELADRAQVFAAGTISVQGRGGDMASLSGNASFERLGIVIGDYRVTNAGPASAVIRADRITVTSLSLQGQDTKLSVTGNIRPLKEYDLSVSGTARLTLLRPIVPAIEYSDGTADIKASVRDAWSHPDFSGSIFMRNGELKVKDLPQKFSALAARATFDENSLILESLTGEVGGGLLSASGKAQFASRKLLDFSSRVTFENVSVRYPEGLNSTLTGELSYDGNTTEQSLTGDVAIKRARYDKRIEWKSMLVDIGRGLYQKNKTETEWIGDTLLNIRFSGRENILLQNNLAKIPLGVDIFLRGTVNQPQLLGRIEAQKGSVYFRQNEFKILHSSVDFVDPNRMNPVLDIKAEITVRDFLIRMAVSGTADRAVVTFLSEPPLPDTDILALLALGKRGSELRGKETSVGMSEAASFATGQFQDVFESRARSLTGLDRFQVDPYITKADTSVPRVTVGKEIVQDRLYVTYSSNVGAATPEQIFRIEYILNKHFSVVGERNELGNTGADFKYRFEFR